MSQINDNEKEALKEYASLKVEIREKTARLGELKPLVEEVLVRVDALDNPVETPYGQFTLRPRRIWVYSPELEQRIKQVKADKKNEEATGKATFEEIRDVYFK